uniref:RNA-dependent RNA polymerase n=1 Tax=Hubei myriapoda virus 6 TaxID=1922935 RepID=A0A1L3KPL9_9VIRU|nr:RNA-dependent RNA polymerase [Hubei myriapoda virus 6]
MNELLKTLANLLKKWKETAPESLTADEAYNNCLEYEFNRHECLNLLVQKKLTGTFQPEMSIKNWIQENSLSGFMMNNPSVENKSPDLIYIQQVLNPTTLQEEDQLVLLDVAMTADPAIVYRSKTEKYQPCVDYLNTILPIIFPLVRTCKLQLVVVESDLSNLENQLRAIGITDFESEDYQRDKTMLIHFRGIVDAYETRVRYDEKFKYRSQIRAHKSKQENYTEKELQLDKIVAAMNGMFQKELIPPHSAPLNELQETIRNTFPCDSETQFKLVEPSDIPEAFTASKEKMKVSYNQTTAKPSSWFIYSPEHIGITEHERDLDKKNIVYLQELLKTNGVKPVTAGGDLWECYYEMLTNITLEETEDANSGKKSTKVKLPTKLKEPVKAAFHMGKKYKQAPKPNEHLKCVPIWDEDFKRQTQMWAETESAKLTTSQPVTIDWERYNLKDIHNNFDRSVHAREIDEVRPLVTSIRELSAYKYCKAVAAVAHSMLVQPSKDAGKITLMNKGDKGLYILTLPSRQAGTVLDKGTIPFVSLALCKNIDKLINSDEVQFIMKITNTNLYLCVSKPMRLDGIRLESLTHAHLCFEASMLSWLMQIEAKTQPNTAAQWPMAVLLFTYCLMNQTTRTAGCLENLRYVFMNSIAVRANLKIFMLESGSFALKTKLQALLYYRTEEFSVQSFLAAKDVLMNDLEIEAQHGDLNLDRLGVQNVKLPSFMDQGFHKSFLGICNEIMGLYFNVAKGLHGPYHRDIQLMNTPLKCEADLREQKDLLINRSPPIETNQQEPEPPPVILGCGLVDNLTEFSRPPSEIPAQTASKDFCSMLGKFVNEKYLMHNKDRLLEGLVKIGFDKEILRHHQFTSTKSMLTFEMNKLGEYKRSKVLPYMVKLVETEFKGVTPTLMEFTEWTLLSATKPVFAISPKQQRTLNDREIYIGNAITFGVRSVEMIMRCVAECLPGECIKIPGDKKYIEMSKVFKEVIKWSKSQNTVVEDDYQNGTDQIQSDKNLHFPGVEVTNPTEEELVKLNEIESDYQLELQRIQAMKDWAYQTDAYEKAYQAKLDKQEEVLKKPIYSGNSADLLSEELLEDIMSQLAEESVESPHLNPFRLVTVESFTGKVHLLICNNDRKKWSAKDVAEKFELFIAELTVIPLQLRTLMIAVLRNHRRKRLQLGAKYVAELEKNKSMPENARLLRMVEDGMFVTITQNWLQGMLNYTSSVVHTAVMLSSWEMFLQLFPEAKACNGMLEHSDDSVELMCYIPMQMTLDPEIHTMIFQEKCERPVEELWLAFDEWCGSLASLKYSPKKSNMQTVVCEFISNYMIYGDQAYPWYKHVVTSFSQLPGTSLADDMYAAFSQLMVCGARGGPGSLVNWIMKLAADRIDRLYSTGPGMHNDVAKYLKLDRRLIPMELGGTPNMSAPALILAGPGYHDANLLAAATNRLFEGWEKTLFLFLMVSPKGVFDVDSISYEESDISKITGFSGPLFKNLLEPREGDSKRKKSKLDDDGDVVDDPRENGYVNEMTHANCYNTDQLKAWTLTHPAASIQAPKNNRDLLMYWHDVMQRPSYRAACARSTGRGLLIKRCQWTTGPFCKLKSTDSTWIPLRQIFIQLNDDFEKRMKIPGVRVITNEEISYLQAYTDAISSTVVSLVTYLGGARVDSEVPKTQHPQMAQILAAPNKISRIVNDPVQVALKTWDKFEGPYVFLRRPERFEEDSELLCKVVRPIKSRLNAATLVKYDIFINVVSAIGSFKDAELVLKEAYKWDEATFDEIVKAAETSKKELQWVSKMFRSGRKSRIVITKAGNHTSQETLNAFLTTNSLAYKNLKITFSEPWIAEDSTHLELFSRLRIHDDTSVAVENVGYAYYKCLEKGLPLGRLKDFLLRSRFKGKTVLDILRIAKKRQQERLLNPRTNEIVAVLTAYLQNDFQVADEIYKSQETVLRWYDRRQHYDQLAGAYTGGLAYWCVYKGNCIQVTGALNQAGQMVYKYTTNCKEWSTVIHMLKVLYVDIHNKSYDASLPQMRTKQWKGDAEDPKLGFAMASRTWHWQILNKGNYYLRDWQFEPNLKSPDLLPKLTKSKSQRVVGIHIGSSDKRGQPGFCVIAAIRRNVPVKFLPEDWVWDSNTTLGYYGGLNLDKLLELRQFKTYIFDEISCVPVSDLLKVIKLRPANELTWWDEFCRVLLSDYKKANTEKLREVWNMWAANSTFDCPPGYKAFDLTEPDAEFEDEESSLDSGSVLEIQSVASSEMEKLSDKDDTEDITIDHEVDKEDSVYEDSLSRTQAIVIFESRLQFSKHDTLRQRMIVQSMGLTKTHVKDPYFWAMYLGHWINTLSSEIASMKPTKLATLNVIDSCIQFILENQSMESVTTIARQLQENKALALATNTKVQKPDWMVEHFRRYQKAILTGSVSDRLDPLQWHTLLAENLYWPTVEYNTDFPDDLDILFD